MAILKTKEIAERSGVTVLILQRWDNNGALKAYCAPMLKVLFLMKQLLKEVMDNQVDTIFITYKDRFIRFGYDWFENNIYDRVQWSGVKHGKGPLQQRHLPASL